MSRADLSVLEELLDERGTRAALVVRRVRVVAEWLWEADAETQFAVYSCTKSFTAVAVGMLAEEGKLALDQPAADFIPEWRADDRNGILIRHLLSMTSGLAKTDSSFYSNPDPVGFAVTQPLQAPPGTTWDYNDVACACLSPVVRAAAGEELSAYLKRRLYDVIGIRNYRHEEPAGHTLPYSGLRVTARDLARFGHLCLHGGAWNGRQVVPSAFLAEATRSSQSLNPHYGLLFWPNAAGRWPDLPSGAYAARGAYGNEMLLFPDAEMIVVRLVGTKPESDIDLNRMGALALAALS